MEILGIHIEVISLVAIVLILAFIILCVRISFSVKISRSKNGDPWYKITFTKKDDE